jgi:predicted DNA-binding transcriptional regulator AlpA
MFNTPVSQLTPGSYVREAQLVNHPPRKATQRKPPRPASVGILAISAPTLWRWVREKNFPAPVRLSSGVTAWKSDDVIAWMQSKSE